ncbi:MAG: ribosomal protein S18-alanine N-acetyltransferase [Nitrospinota bacterium]
MSRTKPLLPVRIREMRESDLDAVLRIEREAFPVPWSRENFRVELRNPAVSRLLVAEPEGEPGTVAGYACYSLVVDEAHITNFTVRRDFRRRGVAEQLLQFLLDGAVRQGARQATLEVRASNEPATRLYAKFGFAPVGVRKEYYPDNREDALVMLADLGGSADPAGA